MVKNSLATSFLVEFSDLNYCIDSDLIQDLVARGFEPGTIDSTWASAFDRLRLNTAVTAYETAIGSVRELLKKTDVGLAAIVHVA